MTEPAGEDRRYELVECGASHIAAIVPRLRMVEQEALAASRLPATTIIERLWAASSVRRAVSMDGEVIAVWGCMGRDGQEGHIWLFTSVDAWSSPEGALRQVPGEIRSLLRTRSSLETPVLGKYREALQFFEMIGFAVSGDLVVNGVPFLQLRMSQYEWPSAVVH